MSVNARAHVFVSGRVQGVFFRQNAKDKAEELGIKGWVKNLADGRVEAAFEGQKDKVEMMLNWMKKGPLISRVDQVEVAWEQCQNEFRNFEIRHE